MDQAQSGEYRVLLPLLNPGLASDLVGLAGRLIGRRPGRVIILGIVEVPGQAPLSEGLGLARAYRIMLDNLAENIRGKVEVQTQVRVHREAWKGIVETALDEKCDLLLLPWKGFTSTPNCIYGSNIDEILNDPPCDVVVSKGTVPAFCGRILLPVRGGPHAELALRVASALASDQQVDITVLHNRPSDDSTSDDSLYECFEALAAEEPAVTRVITTSAGVLPSILHEASKHDLLIMGAAADLVPGPSPLGPVTESVSSKVGKPVLVVKTRQWSSPRAVDKKPGDSAASTVTLSEKVDRWFAENTFHFREFNDTEHLLELKRRNGCSITVAVPLGRRPKAISGFVRTLIEELQRRVPLVDEIALVDETERADGPLSSLDLPMICPNQVLREYGCFSGRGDHVWKSLFFTRGDLVVWLDTDTRNGTNPAHVLGLLGPLLREPGIVLVKGFFPPLLSDSEQEGEMDDPLTTLLVRPMLSLLVPDLSGVIDPMCGEWAARRSVLETLPILSGAGFDVKLLMDVYDRYGLDSIAQVDVGDVERSPRSYHPGIQIAASSVINLFTRRLEDRHQLRMVEEAGRSTKLVRRLETGYRLDLTKLMECDRPPLTVVPGYGTNTVCVVAMDEVQDTGQPASL